MRHGTSNNRRHRNRNNNNNNGGRHNGNQSRTQVYDSNGPDVRIRGSANQVAEKYLALAKDATVSGDSTVAENYFQHAEHYIRIINEISGAQEANKVKGRPNANAVADDKGNRNDNSMSPKTENVVDEEVEDLALPASILGADATAKTKSVEINAEAESVD